jgi:Carboxypeptidase regulatory-like domain/TonB-dependent Receptor Plug Domain
MKFRVLWILILLCVPASLLLAQGGSTGTILGTVTDNSGAVIARASVDITNVGTGVTTHSETSSAGDFTAPYLTSGTYKIVVESAGFQKGVTDNVPLAVAQQVRVNVQLLPGSVAQSVEVSANQVSMDTDTSAVSQEISRRQVNDLPLNGRNFLDLLRLTPGQVTATTEASSFRQGAESGISINGQRATSNSYTLDGMPNIDASEAQAAVILSVDAIQEFAVQSSTYGAQFGFSASQVNLVTRGGTNNLHGTLYEFDRNDAFDAKGPFQTSLPPLRQNQFGYAAGGPIYIPHLYNGRDKTFWFASYEGWRINSGTDNFFIVPTPDTLAGHFTQPLTDPATGAAFPGCTANGVKYGSCVPQARWSRLASLAIAKNFFPAPNSTSPSGNFEQFGSAPLNQNEQDYRIDQNLGRWGAVFGRGTYGTYVQTEANNLSVPIGNTEYDQAVTSWAISHTKSFGANAINRAYFSHLNFHFDEGTADPISNQDLKTLGFTNYFSNITGLQAAYPNIAWGVGGISNGGGAVNAYLANQQPEWDLGDSLTISHGRHTITTGLDYRNYKLNRNYNQNFLGLFTFSGFATGGSAPTVQNAVADFLLGYFSQGGNAYVPGPNSNTTTPGAAGNPTSLVFSYTAPYIQDDWKVSPNLTLNLGIRYDYKPTPHDAHNYFFWRDPENSDGGLCTADKSLIGKYGVGVYRYCGESHPPTPKLPFAPRLGFAYRIGNPMVIRGGYGIFFDNYEGREFDNSQNLCPFSNQVNISQSTGQTGLITSDTLWPAASPTCSFGPTSPLGTYNLIPPVWHNPYVQQYSLSFEHQLAHETTIEVNYVGNKGERLLSRNNVAQAYAPTNPTACQADDNAPGCPVADREPFPNFNLYIEEQFEGYSNYNAGTVKLEHRGRDLAITTFYTYSNSLDDKSAAAAVGATNNGWQGFLNNHNPAADYGRSDFNTPHRFVVSSIYQLPFGRGKRILGGVNKAADLAVGGWQVNGIFNWQSGLPFSVTAPDATGVLQTNGAPNRMNQVGNPNPGGFHKTISNWFDTSAFAAAPNYEFGTTGRNILRAPNWNNLDFSIFKTFAFTEHMRFELRGEAFNALNHAEYQLDAEAGDSSNATQYGKILAANPGRIVQIGGKFYF